MAITMKGLVVCMSLLVFNVYAQPIPSDSLDSSRHPNEVFEYLNIVEKEIRVEEEALQIINSELSHLDQLSNQHNFQTILETFMDSHRRRTLHREKLVDYIPEDVAMSIKGLEYLAEVGSRYTDNVM